MTVAPHWTARSFAVIPKNPLRWLSWLVEVTTLEVPEEVPMVMTSTEAYRQSLGDRCDRCGAQGFVLTMHEAGVLVWCGHHYNKHEAQLAPYVFSDHRDRLT